MLATTMQPTEVDHRGQIMTFVEEWVATVEPQPTHLVIAHAPLSGHPVILDTAATGPDKQRETAELAERFYGAAHSHAVATGGWQRYTVAAMAGSTVLAQRMLVIETMQAARMHDGSGELGDAATVVKHLLRHDERMHRLLVEDREVSLKIMQAQLVTMSAERQAMQQQFTDSFLESMKLMRELGDRKHERDLEIQRETAKDERQAQMLEMLQVMMPVLVARMTGATAANRLIQSIDPDMRRHLFAALDPAQQEDLGELLKLADKGEEAERALGRSVAEHFERVGLEVPDAVRAAAANESAADDDAPLDDSGARLAELEAELARERAERERERAELAELRAAVEAAAKKPKRKPTARRAKAASDDEEGPCSS